MNTTTAPPAAHALARADVFFAQLRIVTGRLDTMQARIALDLLKAASSWPLSWVAYGLATAWHEARLRPIEEIGHGHGHPYGVPGRHGGQVPYGRGLVQLTWDRNYELADARLGLNGALIRDYRLALDPEIAVRVLVKGMEGGWFSGKRLADYLPDRRGNSGQFVQARRIINGTDLAGLIAEYAMQFQAALAAGGRA